MSSSTSAVAPAAAARSIIHLGMDVHKESITIAVLPERAKGLTRLDRVPNNLPKLKRWLDRVARDGVQRKHDTQDAADLARLYRAGELVAVHIPSEAEERVRDVVRSRDVSARDSQVASLHPQVPRSRSPVSSSASSGP